MHSFHRYEDEYLLPMRFGSPHLDHFDFNENSKYRPARPTLTAVRSHGPVPTTRLLSSVKHDFSQYNTYNALSKTSPKTGTTRFICPINEFAGLPYIELEVQTNGFSQKVNILLDTGSGVTWIPRTIKPLDELPIPDVSLFSYNYPITAGFPLKEKKSPTLSRRSSTKSLSKAFSKARPPLLSRHSSYGPTKAKPPITSPARSTFGSSEASSTEGYNAMLYAHNPMEYDTFKAVYSIGSGAWGEVVTGDFVFPTFENQFGSQGFPYNDISSHQMTIRTRYGVSRQNSCFCGVFGLSFGNLFDTNILYKMRNSGSIKICSYTIQLAPIYPHASQAPSIEFGTANNPKLMNYVRMLPLTDTHIFVKVSHTITSTGHDLGLEGPVILDTGAWFIGSPAHIIYRFEAFLGFRCNQWYPHSSVIEAFDNNQHKFVKFILKNMMGQRFCVKVPLHSFIQKLDNGYCKMALKVWNDGMVLGTPFLRSAVIHYNLELLCVGFKPTEEISLLFQ